MVMNIRFKQVLRACPQQGFTYLSMLVAIAVLGVGLSAVSEIWVSTTRRQKLAELDWRGRQFVQAIGSYYQATPGTAKVYPADLEDLIEDRRYVTVRRHLRQVYANPFSEKLGWKLIIAADGRIRGVQASVPGESGATVREFVYIPGTGNL